MIDIALQPKFARPPVIEVVHGVRFRRLDLTIAHPGQFHALLRDRYPRVQTVPALPAEREFFGGSRFPVFRLEMPLMAELPRAWFVSADNTMLIQLQQDRILVNWRSNAGQGIYPHYSAISERFKEIYRIFTTFVADAGLGDLAAELCEMTYINHMGSWPRDVAMTPQTWLRGWSGDQGFEWTGEMEDFATASRFALRRPDGQPFGRLTVQASTIIAPPTGDRSLQVEITVRGHPDVSTFDGVRAFHDMAHDRIVRCFAAITTESAHKDWGRLPA